MEFSFKYLVVAEMVAFLTGALVATLPSPSAAACSSLQQLPSSATPFTTTASPPPSGTGVAAATTALVVGASMESISRAAKTFRNAMEYS